MTRQTADSGAAQRVVEKHRARILTAVDRPTRVVGQGAEALVPDRREFLRLEAEDLYWNELSWEEETREERVVGGHLTELVFPGFLSFIDGLLPGRSTVDLAGGPRPHPDVVEEILLFLGEREAELTWALERGADSERLVWARTLTAGLIDIVLCRLHQITPTELEDLEALE
jgi:hypothetical protein